MLLKLNTAFNRTFSFVGVSLTSLSVTISKDGAAFGAIAGALTQITGNFYKLALVAGDVDTVGSLGYKFSDTVLGVVVPNGEDVDQVGAPDVTLADGVAHGGTLGVSTATIAFSNMAGVSQTVDTDALMLQGNGSGFGANISGISMGAFHANAITTSGSVTIGSDFSIIGQLGLHDVAISSGFVINNGGFAVLNSGGDALYLSGSTNDINLAGSSPIAGLVPTTNDPNTIMDCLNAARANGFGDSVINAGTKHWQVFAPDGITPAHEWIVDSVTAPLTRTTV